MKVFRIGDWKIDTNAGLAVLDDTSVRLEPKTMAVLQVLAQANGDVVSRQTIMDAVWPNQDLTDDVLTSAISTLRRALGDDPKKNRLILTLPKRGYRIVAPIFTDGIARLEGEESGVAARTPSRMLWSFTGLLAVAIVTSIAAWSWFGNKNPKPEVLKNEDHSIAVLPLDVFSENPQIEHFSGGLEEELIHQLAQTPDLRVVARTSSAQFRGKRHNTGQISEILDVRYVIEGSVRDSSEGIRITLQLIDTNTDSHVWSRVFDVKDGELIAVQEQVGLAVSQLVSSRQDRVEAAQRPRHPVPDSAYRLFLLGESHMRVGTPQAYRKANSYFADATLISPTYALAYSRLAATYLLLYQYDSEPLNQSAQKAKKALETAMNLEPDQPEALATMGLLYTYLKDYTTAEKYFLEALQIQGNLRFALHNYGFMLWMQVRYKDALVYLNRALAIDPLSGVTNFLVGDSLAGSGQLQAAQEHFEECQQLLPDYVACSFGMATLQLLQSDLPSAQETLKHTLTLVPADNFLQLSIMASLSVQQHDYIASSTFLDQAFQQMPLDYPLLRLNLLNGLASDALHEHISQLQKLLAETPSDPELRLIEALGFYYENDCLPAIEIYESEMRRSSAFLLDVWDLAAGFSHAASMAYCYAQTSQPEAQNEILSLIRDYLSDGELESFPGKVFLRYKYHALMGDSPIAQQALKQLAQQQWPLFWLAAREPIQPDSR